MFNWVIETRQNLDLWNPTAACSTTCAGCSWLSKWRADTKRLWVHDACQEQGKVYFYKIKRCVMSMHPGSGHHFQKKTKSSRKLWWGPKRRLQEGEPVGESISNPSHPHRGPRVLGPEECPPPVWCLARSDPPLAPPQPSPQSAPSSQRSQPRIVMFWLHLVRICSVSRPKT